MIIYDFGNIARGPGFVGPKTNKRNNHSNIPYGPEIYHIQDKSHTQVKTYNFRCFLVLQKFTQHTSALSKICRIVWNARPPSMLVREQLCL